MSSLPSWCQIVLLAIMVSNCPKCQMVLGVKLSAVSNGPRIQSEAQNIYSHLYLRVLSPPGPCQALTINYNNQTIWILKLSLFSQFNSSQSPGLPQLTRHWIQVFLLKKDLPKPCTPPSPPGSSCREFSPPLRPPAGLQDG